MHDVPDARYPGYQHDVLGEIAVTVQFRTALFPGGRPTSSSTPSPDVFHTLANVFRDSLLRQQLRLPSLADLEAAAEDESVAKSDKFSMIERRPATGSPRNGFVPRRHASNACRVRPHRW